MKLDLKDNVDLKLGEEQNESKFNKKGTPISDLKFSQEFLSSTKQTEVYILFKVSKFGNNCIVDQ